MPFSFIDVEEEKSRIIAFVFFFIVLIYFLTAYLLLLVTENTLFYTRSYAIGSSGFTFPPLTHVIYALIAAFVAAALHWLFSTNNLIEKLSTAAGAVALDNKDIYHQYFQNIIDEVSVAIGGRKIEAMVIPSVSMNAFALEDFEGRAVIGITEGLLARLNRTQIEAVVAHEAGHIASKDSLITTVLCSLGELYEEGLLHIRAGLRRSRGKGSVGLVLIYAVLSLMHFLSKSLRYFLSRQREYRADAIAVRLTRNPLGLAEALHLISGSWRGAGDQGERLQSIFIVNPRFDRLDEKDGLAADMFSTHPPIKQRINILLSMAHLDAKALEENLKNFVRVSPVAGPVLSSQEDVFAQRWQVFADGEWKGPFDFKELKETLKIIPTQWVKLEGEGKVKQASDDPQLKEIFLGAGAAKGECLCPRCKVAPLAEYNYEGAPVFKCNYCAGVFADYHDVTKILIRRDYQPSQEMINLAEKVYAAKNKKTMLRYSDPRSPDIWIVDCPKCKRKMRRQFFVYSYPVEIDRCIYCSGVWFDKYELEILQYMFDHKDRFLYDEQF